MGGYRSARFRRITVRQRHSTVAILIVRVPSPSVSTYLSTLTELEIESKRVLMIFVDLIVETTILILVSSRVLPKVSMNSACVYSCPFHITQRRRLDSAGIEVRLVQGPFSGRGGREHGHEDPEALRRRILAMVASNLS